MNTFKDKIGCSIANIVSYGSVTLATITGASILTIPNSPAQAADFTQSSSLQWTGDTSDFNSAASSAITSNMGQFSVTFNIFEESSVRGATGDFAPFFPTVPPPEDFVTNSPTVNFMWIADSPTPPGLNDAAEFQIDQNLVFEFQTPDGPGSPVRLTMPAGSTFVAQLEQDGGVEVELDIGEYFAELPNGIEGNANSSTLTFDQSGASIIGVYSGTADFNGDHDSIPEPGTVLGLLSIGGLGLLAKCKKQA